MENNREENWIGRWSQTEEMWNRKQGVLSCFEKSQSRLPRKGFKNQSCCYVCDILKWGTLGLREASYSDLGKRQKRGERA